jgi:predicted protein tyrosine phosphatase
MTQPTDATTDCCAAGACCARKGAWWLPVVIIAAVVGGGIWLYEEVIEEYYLTTRWGQTIDDKLFRCGDLPPYRVKALLEEAKINVVVNLNTIEPDKLRDQMETQAINELGITGVNIPMRGDGVSTAKGYADAVETVYRSLKDGKRVLVHCAAGTNRTGGVIATYRMLVEKMPPDKALAEMLQYNFEPHRNTELLPFMNQNMPEIARLLHERGVIDAVPDPIPLLSMAP